MTVAVILQDRSGAIYNAQRGESVATVAARLAEHKIGALPIMDGENLVGIFSERDVIYGLAEHGGDMLTKSVGDVMTAEPITVTSETPILSALSLMTRRRIRHLPVMDGDNLTGFVSIGDLVKHRIEKIEAEATAMRDYIQMA